MAVKKTTKKKDESATPTTKAEAKETAPKKKSSRPKKSAAAAPAAPEPTPAPAETGAAKPAKKGAAKKAAAAPVKLSASQTDLLKKISETAESGYAIGKKIEQRSIEALQLRKLIKKGAKNKETGNTHYLISSAGKKHLDGAGS